MSDQSVKQPPDSPKEHQDDVEKLKFKELELSVGFWLKRLDHTLTHTAASNQQIYIVDGAVLALMYFAMQTFAIDAAGQLSPRITFLAAAPTLLLAVLNFFHARLVFVQGKWYSKNEVMLLQLLDQKSAWEGPRRFYTRTHSIYAAMHVLIGVFLLGVGGLMLAYGMHCFELITGLKPPKA